MARIYELTAEGRQRFARIRENMEVAQTEGYIVLEYLYDNATGTAKEIAAHTGLSSGQVMRKLEEFIKQNLVRAMADL